MMKERKKIDFNRIFNILAVMAISGMAGLGMDLWSSSFGFRYPIDTFIGCSFAGLVSMVLTLLIVGSYTKSNKVTSKK